MCCKTLLEALNSEASFFIPLMSASENGRRFSIQFRKAKTDSFCRIKIDGGIVSESDPGERCDYVFYQCLAKDAIFLELKGKDTGKALNQIYATIRLVTNRIEIAKNKIHGCIVASRVPMTSVETQVIKNEFKSRYGGRLEIHTRKYVWMVDSQLFHTLATHFFINPTRTIHKNKPMSTPLLGLRTAIYRVPDLDAAKRWYTDLLGFGPYFDEPFYVGFEAGGYELGLQPVEDEYRNGPGGTETYWGVDDVPAAYERLLSLGATPREAPQEVGGGIVVATVNDPWGNIFGLIYNPHFGKAVTRG